MLFEEELAPSEDELTTADIREPGLYPRFTFFHATARSKYLSLIPKKINWLGSTFSLTQGYTKGAPTEAWLVEAEQYAHNARIVFLDSGAISTLLRFDRGKGTPEQVREWLERQDLVLETAFRLQKAGCNEGIVAAMDLPSTAIDLERVGFKFQEGLDITFRNALAMSVAVVPEGWRRIYMVQGREPKEFVECAQRYDEAGLLDEVREGKSLLGIGGIHRVKSPALENTVIAVRKVLGEGHIHALGVARARAAPLAARKLIDSSDAASTQLQVTKNLEPYHITGPRPTFLLDALWAAAMLRHDTLLARKIAELEANDQFMDQEELAFDD